MNKTLLVACVSLSLLSVGCSNLTAAWYGAETVGYTAYNRAKTSNDVVVVKGEGNNPHCFYMRRGVNKLWGPSPDLNQEGFGFWEYVETNRRIQIYDNIGVAIYGKYGKESKNGYVLSDAASKALIDYMGDMDIKYPSMVDYAMYEHLLRKQAEMNETVSELKQEKKMFKNRNK